MNVKDLDLTPTCQPEFDVRTLQRLLNELTRVSQTRDRGAMTPDHKRAKQTAMAALKNRLFKRN